MKPEVMTDDPPENESLPGRWTEQDATQEGVSEGSPRQPALFERAGDDRAVRIHPSGPDMPHDDGREWQVGLAGGEDEAAEPIARVDGRDTAYDVATEFMAAYEAALTEPGDASALERATERAEEAAAELREEPEDGE